MAESNREPMSMEAFRAKKASSPTADKSAANSSKSANSSSTVSSSMNSAQSRPASASRTNSARLSASAENLSGDRYGPAPDQRQSRVKLLREKQAEERKRKNEERRLAFEERRRKKEEEEKERWTTLKQQVDKHSVPKSNSSALKPGSGRKLPNVPTEVIAKRPGSAVQAPSRPSSLPKPLTRPSSANPAKSPNRSSAGSLSGGSTPKESPASIPNLQPKPSLGAGRSVSASNLDTSTVANRRASGGPLQARPSSGTKTRPRTSSNTSAQTLDKSKTRNSVSHESLLPPGGKLTKSHSTSSIQNVGKHKSTAEKSHKTETKPKAGVTDEATAKQALAERRKKAREEAERQAALDKERQEAERLKREEEERIRAEEEAREEARMRELAELLQKQEEERLQAAEEERKRKEQEEVERAAAEKKRKEEEEQKARDEAERRAQEDEERRKQEEAARLERKRRVEQIMSRTRQTASPTTTEEAKELDPDDTKRKVNEILQKVKGSQGSSSHNIADNDGLEEEQGNNNESKTSEEVKLESEITSLNTQHENSFAPIDTDLNGVDSSELPSSENKSSTEQTSELHVVPPLITLQPDSTFTPIGSTNSEHENEAVLFQYKEDSSVTLNKENHSVNGTDQIVETENLTNAEATVAFS